MDRIKKITQQVKDHLKRNEQAYVIGSVSALMIVCAGRVNWSNAQQITAFLVKKGIDPQEFWLPEEDFQSIT